MDKNLLEKLNYKDKIISRDLATIIFISWILLIPIISLSYIIGMNIMIIMPLLFITISKIYMLSTEDIKINALRLYKSLGVSEEEYIKARYIYIIKSYTKTFFIFLILQLLLKFLSNIDIIGGASVKSLIILFFIPLGVSAFSIQTSIARYNKNLTLKEHLPLKVISTLLYISFPVFIQYRYGYGLFNVSENLNVNGFNIIYYIILIILTILNLYISYKSSVNLINKK